NQVDAPCETTIYRKRRGLYQNYTTDGFRTIFHRFCTFNNCNFGCDKRINFWSMFGSPLLTFLLDSIIYHEYAIAMHAVDNRLCNGSTCLHHSYAWNVL